MSADPTAASLQPVRRTPPPVMPVACRVACFSILAEAEPGVMPRVLELFAKRNLVPDRWHSDRTGPGGRDLAIDLQVEGMTPELASQLAGGGIVTREDLAEQSVDEVLEIATIDEAMAGDLIMSARAVWFEDEEQA